MTGVNQISRQIVNTEPVENGVIPKTAELLIVACLDNEPEKCDSHQLSLQLN
jgi:hypothetical protein